MPTPINIKGPDGQVAAVADSALVVSELPVPAFTSNILSLPYSTFFTVDGDGGSEDLRVVGSLLNPISALIKAEDGADIYIKEIKIIIADTVGGSGMVLSNFGGILSGVTNGFIPYFEDKSLRLQINDRPLFTNLDFIRVGSLTAALGADDTAFRLKGAKAGSDFAYLPSWDMTRLSAGSNGVRLVAGSKQSFGVEIRDDISALGGFEILAIGFRRFIN